MPYSDRNEIPQLEANQRLARYVPITKLVDLLRRRALYFTSITKLKESDAHEGRFDKNELRQILTTSLQSQPDGSALLSSAERLGVFDIYGAGVRAVFASCWYSFDTESNLMWSQYAGNDGVMLLTSVKRFQSAVEKEKRDVHIGRIDYNGAPINYRDAFQPALRKREGFSNEREIRALAFDADMMGIPPQVMDLIRTKLPHISADILAQLTPSVPDGIHIECDPSNLLEEIRVPPNSPEYVREAVQQVVESIGFTIAVRRSDMDD